MPVELKQPGTAMELVLPSNAQPASLALALLALGFLVLLVLTGTLSREEWDGARELIRMKRRGLDPA